MAKAGKFTDILLRQRVISPEQLAEAVKTSKTSGKKLHDELVRLGYATGEEVIRAMAQEHGMDFINLNEVNIPASVIELLPESVARENAVLPLAQEDGSLKVIFSDPLDFDTREKLRFILNRNVEVVLAPRENILGAINRYYGKVDDQGQDSMLQEFTDTAIDFTETESETISNDENVDEASAPIVKLVHLIITEAVQLRASDIHIEPFEDRVRVRYRIDGVLVQRDCPPRRLLGAILSRIKILSKLDIAERRRPQDGRIKVTIGDKELDLRVSLLPTNHGQSAVMRILDKDNIKVGVRQLGLSEHDFKNFKNLIRRPNGI
ncbi:MAG TPA: ATPase, T2SS/T4P/T4SS family, partial [Pirellulales bacterium]|nr:ATPase, T2SS/T4P/T4SS family [Pirellulales bacterium]